MMVTRREATRAATIQEIKDTALALMRAQGTVDITLSDVAREMRMSAPGLYRYFDGREALLSALILDSLTDLAERVEAARDAVPVEDPGGRFVAICRAYREWALVDREGFTLIFGPPVDGVARGNHEGVPPEPGEAGTMPPDKAAALRAMDTLRALALDADRQGVRRALPLTTLPAPLTGALCKPELHQADPATELAMIHCWAALHGFVSLEVYRNLDWHGPEVHEPMFLGLVRLLLTLIGLPEPAQGWPDAVPAP